MANGNKESFSLLRGMKDVLPKDEKYWRNMYETAQGLADHYEYKKIETPILEESDLFERSVGEGTDVVNKEMYKFKDRGDNEVALKPENTASIARAYVEHGMRVDPKPVKMWYMDQFYRYERPQSGRYRRFHQLGCESLGVKEPIVEAELIAVAYNFFQDLDIAPKVHINSIGSQEDRDNYVVELKGYLKSKKSYLSEKSKEKLEDNPLRVLDSKEDEDQPIIEEAPQIIDWISEDSKQYLMTVIEYLDEMGIPYKLDSTLVRGLDYYTDTVFEFYEAGKEIGSQDALCGGGRYDKLVEQIGGKEETPAAGFSIGLERVLTIMRRNSEEDREKYKEFAKSNLFFANLGEGARKKSLNILEELRKNDIKAHHNLGKKALRDQLELADEHDTDYAFILGQKEMKEDSIIVRDMETGNQETIPQDEIVEKAQEIYEEQ